MISVLQRIPERARKKVAEITLDMAGNMELICKRCFPQATRVTDRFHVQKLATEALQEMRIKYRWEAMDAENEAIEASYHNWFLFIRLNVSFYFCDASYFCNSIKRFFQALVKNGTATAKMFYGSWTFQKYRIYKAST